MGISSIAIYLVAIVDSYLEERWLRGNIDDGLKAYIVSVDVPQVFVSSPDSRVNHDESYPDEINVCDLLKECLRCYSR